MKKYIVFLMFIVLVFLLVSSYAEKKGSETNAEKKWNGSVSWFQKKTGPELSLSEWSMEASLTNDTGRAVHSSRVVTRRGDVSDCRTVGKAELNVGIDEETGEYSIEVLMPGCYGTVRYYHGQTEDYARTDETAIIIEKQRLGNNPNFLPGFLVEYDTTEARGNTTVTTYRWNLTKNR